MEAVVDSYSLIQKGEINSSEMMHSKVFIAQCGRQSRVPGTKISLGNTIQPH